MTPKDVKRFKPAIDKLFWWILILTSLLLLALTVLTAFDAIFMLLFTIPTDLFVAYFIVSPLFGYAELRDEALFIRFGFFLKREIPYSKIRTTSMERKIYSDSLISLKNALEHVNVKYNKFDVVSLSLKDSENFVAELSERIK